MKEGIAFTDGASRGNPGPGGFGVIVSNGTDVIELGGREDMTTNNRMEMKAAIEAIVYAKKNKFSNIKIYTDSSYLVNGATKWISVWKAHEWQTKTKKSIMNEDLWKELSKFLNISILKVEWKRISGHVGIPANERADKIATSFADKKPVKLFSGIIKNYAIDLSDTRVLKEKVQKNYSSKQKPHSYVSLVNGKVKIHKTWLECEKRVKGVSGAKFKKALSPYEECEIIESFRHA